MQLAMSADVLVPLGAGVVALVIAAFVIVTRGRRPQPDPIATEPTAADWTGEAATGGAAVHVEVPVEAPADTGPRRLTVADAVAVREADTAPIPVTSDAVPARGAAGADTVPEVDDAPEPAGPAPRDEAEPAEPARPEPVRPEADTTGSSRPVAAAVAQALAVRAAAGRRADAPDGPAIPPGDARDRLLAVLLHDPARAVGAAADLEACRGQLTRLSHALRHERRVLAAVLARLAESGLRVDQLARLSGLPVQEVGELLDLAGASVAAPPR